MRETQQMGVFQQPVRAERGAVLAVALAPMAVHPEFQNQGNWLEACEGRIGAVPKA